MTTGRLEDKIFKKPMNELKTRNAITIETERLLLRELTVGDAENFYLLNLDPEVIRYTGDVAFANIEAARQFLAGYDQYEKYGVGRLAVIRKEDEEFLGWSGLKYLADEDEYDIGYRFFRKYWNMGYVTESAKAALDYGFEKLNLRSIIGRAAPENLASIRVLEKLGLKFEKTNFEDGCEWLQYRLVKHPAGGSSSY